MESDPTPHGLTAGTIEDLGERMEAFLPGLSSEHGQASKQFFSGLLPKGAELAPSAGRMQRQANIPSGISGNNFGGNFGDNTFVSTQLRFGTSVSSPDLLTWIPLIHPL